MSLAVNPTSIETWRNRALFAAAFSAVSTIAFTALLGLDFSKAATIGFSAALGISGLGLLISLIAAKKLQNQLDATSHLKMWRNQAITAIALFAISTFFLTILFPLANLTTTYSMIGVGASWSISAIATTIATMYAYKLQQKLIQSWNRRKDIPVPPKPEYAPTPGPKVEITITPAEITAGKNIQKIVKEESVNLGDQDANWTLFHLGSILALGQQLAQGCTIYRNRADEIGRKFGIDVSSTYEFFMKNPTLYENLVKQAYSYGAPKSMSLDQYKVL